MKQKITISVVVLIIVLLAGLFAASKYLPVNIPSKSNTPADVSATSSPFKLLSGFQVEVFADGVKNARVITFDPTGIILISQPSEGKISALPDRDGDRKADEVITVASNLKLPHGMAFYCPDPNTPTECKLYVAETDALNVFDYDADNMKATNKKKLLDLPSGSVGTHFTRTLLFLPSPNENILLIAVGSSCNVCREDDPRRAAVLSYDINSGRSEIYASGLRNSVFMTLHPVTGAVWATEMGRDSLGDDLPPDEVNIIENGKNYGWPVCFGKNIHDDSFDKGGNCTDKIPSTVDLQAHSAPLGLSFVPEEGWPEDYWHNLLVSYHGSWNRSEPTGYKVVRIKLDARGNYAGTEDFITGWLDPAGQKIGRPADIKVMPGGVIYISDDSAGRVYRIARSSS